MTNTERFLRELIALPSVNPAFLPAGHAHAGEHRVAEIIAKRAVKAGLEVEFQSVFPRRANLLARLTPTGAVRRRILLAPHLDTVAGQEAGSFRPVRKDGRLFGRGACDTKGSLAVMFLALEELARNKSRPAETEVIFVALVDEESGQAGSRTLVADGFSADLAIVGEPTSLRVVTAHKGDLWLQLETNGKAAHGARPQLGKNAVHAMAQVVDLLETTYARQLRKRRHPLLGHPTVNVGSIAGGLQPNIVPDHCRISLDRRTLPGETDAAVLREVRHLLQKHRLRATIVDTKNAPCPPLETDPEIPLVKELLRAAAQRKPAGADFFSDAGVLGNSGIPSVLFGPGDIAQAHTADEWIAVSQLERGKDLLVRFLRSLP